MHSCRCSRRRSHSRCLAEPADAVAKRVPNSPDPRRSGRKVRRWDRNKRLPQIAALPSEDRNRNRVDQISTRHVSSRPSAANYRVLARAALEVARADRVDRLPVRERTCPIAGIDRLGHLAERVRVAPVVRRFAYSRQETSEPLGEAQYVLALRKQLKLPTPQPLDGGGLCERRLHLRSRSALAKKRRIVFRPLAHEIRRTSIERATTRWPLIEPRTLPEQPAFAAAGEVAGAAGTDGAASATGTPAATSAAAIVMGRIWTTAATSLLSPAGSR
jgi:hypothetical protein